MLGANFAIITILKQINRQGNIMNELFISTETSWTHVDLTEVTLKQAAASIGADHFRFDGITKRKAKVLAALNMMRVHNVASLTVDGVTLSTTDPKA